MIAEEADTPGATKASSSHTIQKKDGQDDLILMRVPERLFRQHLQANAIESRRRSGATMKTVAEMTKKAQNAIGDHSLDDVEIPGLRDFTTEETVPLRQEMARAAR